MKKGLFRKSYEKEFATELGRYTVAKASLKAAYSQSGEKVPTIKELEQKKTALLQERSEKNVEYQEQKKRKRNDLERPPAMPLKRTRKALYGFGGVEL